MKTRSAIGVAVTMILLVIAAYSVMTSAASGPADPGFDEGDEATDSSASRLDNALVELQAADQITVPKSGDTSAVVCSEVNALWPGADGYGYTGQTESYAWVDITGYGWQIPIDGDDAWAGPIGIGFEFPFYGGYYTSFYASTNGYISFGGGSYAFSNQCSLPSVGAPNTLVALLWDDLYFSASSYAYYASFTSCPVGSGPCLIVEYYNVDHLGGLPGSAGTWETILYPDGDIIIQFQDGGLETGESSTTGIEGPYPEYGDGLTFACNVSHTITGTMAMRFSPPAEPNLGPSNKEAPAQVEWGQAFDYQIVINNSGNLPAFSAVVTDLLPAAVTYVAGSLSCTSGSCGYEPAQNAIYWTAQVDSPVWGVQQVASTVPAGSAQAQASPSPSLTSVSPSGDPVARSVVQRQIDGVMWDQPLSSSNAQANQDFEAVNDAWDIFIADDFWSVDPWSIDTIFVPGNTWNPGCDLSCADLLNWQIYADGGGVPDGDPWGGGNSPVWNLSLPTTDAQVALSVGVGVSLTDVTLNLDTPLNLGPGTWWLVFYPSLSFNTCVCQYGRHASGTTNGYDAQVINPGEGFGFPSTWTSVTDASTWGNADQDFAFRLEGTGLQDTASMAFTVDTTAAACGAILNNTASVGDATLRTDRTVNATTQLVGLTQSLSDMEADDGGFQANPPPGAWAWGTLVPSLYSPPAAHSGTRLWATNLSGDVLVEPSHHYLTHTLTLPVTPNPIQLSWWDWWDEDGLDEASVYVNGTPVYFLEYDQLYWERQSVDLSPWQGQTVEIVFHHFGDGAYDGGAGWYIDDVGVFACPAVPNAPVLAPISNADGNGDYGLDWDEPLWATSYTLEESSDDSFTSPMSLYAGPNSEFSVAGRSGGTWYYRAKASSRAGEGLWSNTESVTVKPDAPTLDDISNADRDGAYLLDWSDSVGASGYILQEDDNQAFSSPSTAFDGPSSQHPVAGHVTGKWYYRVQAYNSAGGSPWSQVKEVDVNAQVRLPVVLRQWPPVPGAPTLHSISNASGKGTYTVDWGSAWEADTYVLEEATNEAFQGAKQVWSGPATSHIITGRGAARYYYRVQGRNKWGSGPWSNVRSVDVTWEAEPNDRSHANGPLVSGLTYQGTLPSAVDQWDYYYIDLESRHDIRLWLTNIPAGDDYALYLFDEVQRRGYSDRDFQPEDIELLGAEPGRYFIAVERVIGGGTQPYSLRASFK